MEFHLFERNFSLCPLNPLVSIIELYYANYYMNKNPWLTQRIYGLLLYKLLL